MRILAASLLVGWASLAGCAANPFGDWSRTVAFKLAAIGVTWWAASDPEHRTLALLALTLPCLVVIGHNYSEGARP